MYEVDVETLTDDCAKNCPAFEIGQTELYQNDEVFLRAFKCIRVDQCRIIQRNLEKNKN